MENIVSYAQAAASIAAAIAVGVGTFGPAIGQGLIGSKAVENIGKYPDSSSKIRTAMLLAMVIVETSALFATLVAGAILFVSR